MKMGQFIGSQDTSDYYYNYNNITKYNNLIPHSHVMSLIAVRTEHS